MHISIWAILKGFWSLLGWLGSLMRPPQGPAVTIAPASIRDAERQDIYPRFIVLENSGTAAACNLEWETRTYYDPLVPPTYDRKRKRLSTALRPGESFTLELLAGSDESVTPGSRGMALADLYAFEVFVRYQNAGKQGMLSYIRIGMAGEIEYRDHAVNLFHRSVLSVEIWFRHLLSNFWINVKVKARPRLYGVLAWMKA